MRRCLPVTLTIALVAALVASSAAARAKSFSVLAVDSSQTNAGGTQNLFEGKTKVGHDSYYCLPGKGGQYCRVFFVFKRGKIDGAGTPTNAKNFTWKIVKRHWHLSGCQGKALGSRFHGSSPAGYVHVHVIARTRAQHYSTRGTSRRLDWDLDSRGRLHLVDDRFRIFQAAGRWRSEWRRLDHTDHAAARDRVLGGEIARKR
jgi:hypothetical protein